MFLQIGFKVDDLERMWVMSINTFFAGKLSEMRMSSDICIYQNIRGQLTLYFL